MESLNWCLASGIFRISSEKGTSAKKKRWPQSLATHLGSDTRRPESYRYAHADALQQECLSRFETVTAPFRTHPVLQTPAGGPSQWTANRKWRSDNGSRRIEYRPTTERPTCRWRLFIAAAIGGAAAPVRLEPDPHWLGDVSGRVQDEALMASAQGLGARRVSRHRCLQGVHLLAFARARTDAVSAGCNL